MTIPTFNIEVNGRWVIIQNNQITQRDIVQNVSTKTKPNSNFLWTSLKDTFFKFKFKFQSSRIFRQNSQTDRDMNLKAETPPYIL